jgi:hypothetical protein
MIKHVSASQVITFRSCKRKWHWEKIGGFRSPSTPSQNLGKAIHAAIEHYILTGEVWEKALLMDGPPESFVERNADVSLSPYVFDVGRFVRAVKDRLNRKTASSEMEFRMATFEGGPEWLGYIDYFCPDELIDFKNFSDLKYAKDEETLLKDIQMNCYARHYFEIFPDAVSVPVSLFYMVTRNKVKVPTKEVKVIITRERCEKIWKGALKDVEEMIQLASVKNSLEIEPNTEACSAYGGCPHRKRCGVEDKKVDASSLFDLDTDSKHEMAVNAPQGIIPPDAPVDTAPEALSVDSGQPSQEDSPKIKGRKAAPKKAGLTLFISCYPTRGSNAVDFAEWVAPIRTRANVVAQQKAEQENYDYRLLAYREPAVLITQVANAHIKEHGLPEAIFVTDRYGFEASEIISILRVHATTIIEGLK